MKKRKPALPKKENSPTHRAYKGYRVWIPTLFFVSAWMFILGIFVGRGTAPVHFDLKKIQKELTALKESVIRRRLNRYKIDSNFEKDKTDLGFYEALKENKNNIGLSAEIDTPNKSRLKKKRPKASTNVPTKRNQTNTPAQTGERISRAALTIQVASLKNRKDADSLVIKLQKKGYPAYRTRMIIHGKGIWYRVRIGNYQTRAEAGSMLSRLRKERLEPFIIHREIGTENHENYKR